MKLAHKWDAPATLGCDDIQVNMTATNVLLEARWYSSFYHFTHSPSTSKVFRLDYKLRGEIHPENST